MIGCVFSSSNPVLTLIFLGWGFQDSVTLLLRSEFCWIWMCIDEKKFEYFDRIDGFMSLRVFWACVKVEIALGGMLFAGFYFPKTSYLWLRSLWWEASCRNIWIHTDWLFFFYFLSFFIFFSSGLEMKERKASALKRVLMSCVSQVCYLFQPEVRILAVWISFSIALSIQMRMLIWMCGKSNKDRIKMSVLGSI